MVAARRFLRNLPRSFADSNNDGVGDLNGITSKMDYLHELGVDAIWITPCYPSPQVDFGYDVSDYEDIDPMYGTLADFDRMVAKEEARGSHHYGFCARTILPTSTRGFWIRSLRGRATSRLVYLARRQGARTSRPTTGFRFLADRHGSLIRRRTSTTTTFYADQPDLNWRNPAVEKAMLDTTRWWYKRGVAGFRLDAVDTLFEDPALRDNPVLPGKNAQGDPNTENKYNTNFPEVHDELQKLRKVADESMRC